MRFAAGACSASATKTRPIARTSRGDSRSWARGDLRSYTVVIVAGEVAVSAEWGKALADYAEAGGTLVVCAGQLSGEGLAALDLPPLEPPRTATSFAWQGTGEQVQAQTFRFHSLPGKSGRVLATAPEGQPVAVLSSRGKGRLITVGIPLGLAVDDRPAPLLALLLRHLLEGITPVRAAGDVEWVLNRLDDGRWLLALLNNSGVEKPQHGIVPTRHEEARTVTLHASFAVGASEEWLTRQPVRWQRSAEGASCRLMVPAGAVRFIILEQEK